ILNYKTRGGKGQHDHCFGTLEFQELISEVYPLSQFEHGADDVLILGTDGLWDVLSNQEVAEAVTGFLANCDPDDQHRYTMAAQDLVMRARGELKDRGWRISNDRLGSGDDISVYIIPLMYGNKQN
uniref:PPM-type phosphatase domain-containing protein n=1 Tax=Xiphophorus couchianus TaxID=32473 RepID=A0A3B5MWC7_9TELE